MSFETFLFLVTAVSLFSPLVVAAVKKILDYCGRKYSSNILAGTVTAVLAVFADIGYVIMTETALNAKTAVILIALVFLSWMGAMGNYDKVIQTIVQIKDLKVNK